MRTTVGVAEEEEEKQSKLSVELKETIDITEKEREIFDRLIGTLRFCNPDTQLRVAGGWVRDKVRTLWNTPATVERELGFGVLVAIGGGYAIGYSRS